MVETFYPTFGGFYQIIEQWQQFGVFTVLLPLILVFAIVFAILEKINILNNKGVHLIIALAVGFFTVSNPYVSAIFMPLFANLAIGVAILIVLVILIGLAIKPDSKSFPYIFGIVGGIIFIVVLARTGMFRVLFGDNVDIWLTQNSAWLVLFIFLALIGVGVILGAKKESKIEMKNLGI
jgi:hypothetical protein